MLLACFFACAWIATFNVAVMNGDDVVHYASSLQRSLLPTLHGSWTPNRVVDTYGRSLLSSIFSFFFFFFNGTAGVSFFLLYKILSASAYAIFMTGVLSYFLRTTRQTSAQQKNNVLKLVLGVFVATLLLLIFQWRNQVHFICYQIPGFLTFLLLKTTNDSRHDATGAPSLTSVLLLSYICCFSLEAFSSIIFIFNLALLGLALREKYQWHLKMAIAGLRTDAHLKILLFNIFFSSASIAVTLLFSERAKEIATGHFDIASVLLGPVALPAAAMFTLVALLTVRSGSRTTDTDDTQVAHQVLFAAGLGLTVVAVTLMVSIRAHFNYFDLKAYPWGDLMVVGKLSALYLLCLALAHVAARKPVVHPVLTLLLIVVCSRLFITFFDRIEADSIQSRRIERVYQVIAADRPTSLITGLDLDAIPMPVRPFPTASSPSWFVASYRIVLQKFYGLETPPDFQ